MGLSFRKGLRFGPIRINLSKGGIGVSAGVKGLRIGTGPRGNYVSAGAHGVYYRKTFGQRRPSAAGSGPPNATPAAVAVTTGRRRLLPIVVIVGIIFVGALALGGATQTTMAIVANAVFVLCLCAFFADRKRVNRTAGLVGGVWFKADGDSTAEFLIAPTNNPAAIQKMISLAGDELRAGLKVETAVMIEAMIGTILLDWRGVTRDGQALPFSPDNIRLLLSESEQVRDFIADKAMELAEEDETPSASLSPRELVERPKPVVIDTTAIPPEDDVHEPRASLAEVHARQSQMHHVSSAQFNDFRLPTADLLNPPVEQQGNRSRHLPIRSIIDSEAWMLAAGHLRLPFILGCDSNNYPVIADLSELPHILIAGTTGTGKSVCIDGIVVSLLFACSPARLRFVMFDLWQTQLHIYNGLPHLVIPVVTAPNKVLLACRWVLAEAERRSHTFAAVGADDIEGFNARATGLHNSDNPAGNLGAPDVMPHIVVVIDELAGLLAAAPDVGLVIAGVAKNGRAAGIHLVLATQNATPHVMSSSLAFNIPARIALRVASKGESRFILDENGAEALHGAGDMLFKRPNAHQRRVQGMLVEDDELRRIVDFVSSQASPAFDTGIDSVMPQHEVSEEDEELIEKCLEVIRQEKRASTSLLQRRLRLGYTRAARIVDILEQRGILGPGEGAEPREILVDLDRTV